MGSDTWYVFCDMFSHLKGHFCNPSHVLYAEVWEVFLVYNRNFLLSSIGILAEASICRSHTEQDLQH